MRVNFPQLSVFCQINIFATLAWSTLVCIGLIWSDLVGCEDLQNALFQFRFVVYTSQECQAVMVEARDPSL